MSKDNAWERERDIYAALYADAKKRIVELEIKMRHHAELEPIEKFEGNIVLWLKNVLDGTNDWVEHDTGLVGMWHNGRFILPFHDEMTAEECARIVSNAIRRVDFDCTEDEHCGPNQACVDGVCFPAVD